MTRLLIRLFLKDNGEKGRTSLGIAASVTGMMCNLILCIAKGIVGIVFGSISIIADAINNLSDLCSTLVTFFGFKLSRKPPDDEHPFGHGRAEYMAGFIVSILVIVAGVELVKSSVEKIIDPQPIEFSWVTVFILLGSVLLKFWMAFFYRSVGKAIDSSAMKASFIDSLTDVIATFSVIIGVLVYLFFGVNIDAYIGLLVSLIIILSGINLIRDTINPLLGQHPSKETVDGITQIVLSCEGIIGMHGLIVHDYGPGRIFASLHAEVEPSTDIITGHDIADKCEKDILKMLNIEAVVHIDPVERSDN